MRLFVSETTVQDAVIPLRWCLSKGELEKLKNKGAKNPHLLVVTVYEQKEVDRYLIPLDQMLTYIQFHKPGKNRILATVVWDSDGNASELRKKFLSQRSTNQYRLRVLDYEEKDLLPDIWPRLKEQAEMTVMVPAEFFAKEPPAWEKWWVNLWFGTQPRDQCQYRRRRMVAYTVQPLLILLFITFISIFRLLAASVLLFFGKRGVDLKPIIHPFLHISKEVWRYTKSSVFLRNAKGKRQQPFITIFSPPVLVGLLAFLVGIRLIFPSTVSQLFLQWWHYPLGALAATIGIAVIAYGLYGLLLLLAFLASLISEMKFPRSKQKRTKRAERREAKTQRATEEKAKQYEEQRRREEQKHAERQRLLACDSELGFIPELKALPKEKQTIYLRFQDLKAKVCKPFAR